MEFIERYFNDEQIYKIVIKARISFANKRKKVHNDREISNLQKDIFRSKSRRLDENLVYKITPPRRSWVKAGVIRRNSSSMNSRKRMWFSLFYTYLKELSKTKKSNWYINFLEFCEEVRTDVLQVNLKGLQSPQIIPVGKNLKTKLGTPEKYRPLSAYYLRTKTIIGLTAKYFINIFDNLYSENVLAFRKSNFGKPAPTHHDAINMIHDFKKRHPDIDLYVVEYDIRKFFDCINHELLINFINLFKDNFSKSGNPISEHALNVLTAYINSYSFYLDIELKNNTDWFLNNNYVDGIFEWVLPELIKSFNYSIEDYSIVQVGVPQGGALSCVIANLYLVYVDKKVLSKYDTLKLPKEDLLYLRYCDDMILIHPDSNVCKILGETYKTAMQDVKLLVHEPKVDFNNIRYNKAFWDHKSKIVYKWANPSRKSPSSIPWIGFVGYQIRYDLKIRVRKSSIKKHKIKLNSERKKISKALQLDINNINPQIGFKVSTKSINNIFTSRMHSLSIGRVKIPFNHRMPRELCWVAGFSALNINDISLRQLRSLDRCRDYQIYKLNKSLPKVSIKSKKAAKGYIMPYFGSPFSYYRFLNK